MDDAIERGGAAPIVDADTAERVDAAPTVDADTAERGGAPSSSSAAADAHRRARWLVRLRRREKQGASTASSSSSSSAADDAPHQHFSHRSGWLRATVLGANDGLVSVSALLLGVSGGDGELRVMQLAGVAGLVAGALSMAVGEYISVSSQKDSEAADVEKERLEQLRGPEAQARELEELTQIYLSRGLTPDTARRCAEELTEADVVRAHARDELGIDVDDLANPLQAALASGASFVFGAAIPLLAGAFIRPQAARIASVLAATAAGLLFFGGLGARLGGAAVWPGALRVLAGGAAAMGASYGIGAAFTAAFGAPIHVA